VLVVFEYGVDFVSFVGGGNDILCFGSDFDVLVVDFECVVE